jgi:hypothetical protein
MDQPNELTKPEDENSKSTIIITPHTDIISSIVVQTRRGKYIDNTLGNETMNQQKTKQEVDKFETKLNYLRKRTNPTSLYNCHGLTFASRRTWIDEKNFSEILNDDGYQEVPENETLPGDIILYFNNQEVSHSGIVVKEVTNDNRYPYIVSKLGSFGEYIHIANGIPVDDYGFTRKYYRVML